MICALTIAAKIGQLPADHRSTKRCRITILQSQLQIAGVFVALNGSYSCVPDIPLMRMPRYCAHVEITSAHASNTRNTRKC